MKRIRPKEIIQTFTCVNCSLTVTKRTSTAKSCSHSCHQSFQRKQNIIKGFAQHRSSKIYLIGVHGNKCWNCGITEWNNKPIVMQLEHIDGNCDNHSLDNLKLLCPNCHSQTETYVGRNKGNGPIIRKRTPNEKG